MKRFVVLSLIVAAAICLGFQSTASASLVKHRACECCAPAACAPVAAVVPAPCKPVAVAASECKEKCCVCPLKKLAAAVKAVKAKICEKCKCKCEKCKCPKACTPAACAPVAPAPKACAAIDKCARHRLICRCK